MKVEISNGELVDKVTILHIKRQKIQDPQKFANVQKEYDVLLKSMKKIEITPKSKEFKELLEVNSSLWKIEDKIRVKEAAKEFDDEFIELARSVYFTNDKRADIKKRINMQTESAVIEEKEYVEYNNGQNNA